MSHSIVFFFTESNNEVAVPGSLRGDLLAFFEGEFLDIDIFSLCFSFSRCIFFAISL